MKIIDFHTHIFPDHIAARAVEALAADSGEYKPKTDGTLKALLEAMDRANISLSLVANIATKPNQLGPILDFCKQLQGERIAPLVSLHPSNDPDDVEDVFGEAHRIGIRGVKLHPMYQQFFIDERRMYPFYELIAHFGFFLMLHTGFDIAFPGNAQADVERVRKIADKFRDLRIVCTHVGGWRQWDRISCLKPCENVMTETSMTMPELSDMEFVRAIGVFGEDRIMFGSDSPWTDQQEMLERTMGLTIPERVKEKLLFSNAAALLGIPSGS